LSEDVLNDTVKPLLDLFRDFSWRTVVSVFDILFVSYLIYRLLALIRGTRAWRVLFGIGIFVALLFISKQLQLNTLYWLLDKATILGPVALVILLLPELRQTLEGFGQLGMWTQRLVSADTADLQAQTVEQIVAAAAEMSASRIGCLIVIERGRTLDEIAASGVAIGAKASTPLLVSIFYEGNPLHDGAVVLRGDVIVAAACRLPLSENPRLDPSLHMRHRAGIGISEQSDCVVIIISEERGTISTVTDGRLRRMAGHVELREVLNRDLRQVSESDDDSDETPKKRLFSKGAKLR
jgi:diadenylate cyclase